MTDEMEYMSISQYCLNLIKNNVKLFLETKYKSIMEKEYKSSEDSFYDVMFYFNVLKKYLDEITELPKVIINTIYNLKIFRNKIAHQVPITLREFYRFVDDTQVILEMLNICDKNEIIKIQNTRKEINNIQNNLNIKNFKSDSDIEMKDFDDDDYDTNKKENSGINYNDFINKNNKVKNINVKDKKEEERMKKINENYKIIMSNSDKNNFMQVKKVDLSKIE